jgi:Yip1 domain
MNSEVKNIGERQSRDRRNFWILTLLMPLLAFALVNLAGFLLDGLKRGEWRLPSPPTIEGTFLGIFLSFAFWGAPAWITAIFFRSGPGGKRPLSDYVKVAAFAATISLVYTLLGCAFVSSMVLDKVSLKYCVDRSILFLQALPPAAFVATLVSFWIATALSNVRRNSVRLRSPEQKSDES